MPLLDLPAILGYVDPLNFLRILIPIPILAYSCVTDWKIRRASDKLWYAIGGIGLVIDLLAIWLLYGSHPDLISSYIILLVIQVAITYALVWLIFQFGGFGGADAKALIALSIMFPLYPLLTIGNITFPFIYTWTDQVSMLLFFWLAVLGNAVLLTIIVPLGVLAYNLLTIPLKEVIENPLRAVIGYKARISDIGKKHLRLMHDYTEKGGVVKKTFKFHGKEPDETTLNRLEKWLVEKKIGEKVWVSPKLPFLIPITLGYLSAVVIGNIMMYAIYFIMGPK